MRPRPRQDQPDQDQAKITEIKTKTGAVLKRSPASACRIRQCVKLQQVVQFKLCESEN